MKSKDASIIIPVYNRHNEVEKLLKYLVLHLDLNKIDINIIDGSDNEFDYLREFCLNSNINYTYYGNSLSFFERILDGLNKVETELVALLGDDDILHPQGFMDCVTFLKENADYAIAHGKYIGFNLEGTLNYNPCYHSPSFEQDLPLERLFAFFSSYTAPTFYAVNRTELLRESFTELINNETKDNDYVSAEILVSAIPIMHGKVKRLDSFYSARRFIPSPNKYVVYAKYILQEDFSIRYQKLKSSILKHLPSSTSLESASDAIDFSFGAYYGQRLSTEELKHRFNSLKINLS